MPELHEPLTSAPEQISPQRETIDPAVQERLKELEQEVEQYPHEVLAELAQLDTVTASHDSTEEPTPVQSPESNTTGEFVFAERNEVLTLDESGIVLTLREEKNLAKIGAVLDANIEDGVMDDDSIFSIEELLPDVFTTSTLYDSNGNPIPHKTLTGKIANRLYELSMSDMPRENRKKTYATLLVSDCSLLFNNPSLREQAVQGEMARSLVKKMGLTDEEAEDVQSYVVWFEGLRRKAEQGDLASLEIKDLVAFGKSSDVAVCRQILATYIKDNPATTVRTVDTLDNMELLTKTVFETYTETPQTKQALDQLRHILGELFMTEAPPIPPGMMFDPQEELATVKNLPKHERKHALFEFRRKLRYMQRGVARITDRLKLAVSDHDDNPNSFQQAIADTNAIAIQHGFSGDARILLGKARMELAKRCDRVEQVWNDVNDPVLLCQEVFKFTPSHPVEVSKTGITITFCFGDGTDCARAYHAGGTVTDEQLRRTASSVGGFFIKQSGTSSAYDGIIIALNKHSTFSATYRHEEQHAFYDALEPFLEKTSPRGDVIHLDEKTRKATVLTEIEEAALQAVERFFLWHQHNALRKAKDEVLAYAQGDNFSDSQVISFLTKTADYDGLYDYTDNVRTKMRAYYSDPANCTPVVAQRVLDSMQRILVDEYQALVGEAVQTFSEARKLTGSLENAVAIFAPIPLDGWKNEVRRTRTVKETTQDEEKRFVEAMKRAADTRYADDLELWNIFVKAACTEGRFGNPLFAGAKAVERKLAQRHRRTQTVHYVRKTPIKW